MTKGKPDKEVVCLDSAVGDEDDADDEDDEGVSLVIMRLCECGVMMLCFGDEMLVSGVGDC